MSETIREKLEETGHRIAEKASEVGHKVGEKVEQAADWAKERTHEAGNKLEELGQKAEHRYREAVGDRSATSTDTDTIEEHMSVVGSCGTLIGVVDHLQGNFIKLTKNGSPDGLHHLIPVSWVDHVDSEVHLNKDCDEAKASWQTV